MKERVGIYGGSFDPVHTGHLILAREAREKLSLDRVLFVPAVVSPHKLERPPASAELRCRLIAAAIENEPGFELDTYEVDAGRDPSFSIDTVREIAGRLPEAELFYFIGDDNLPELHTWKSLSELRRIARFVVFSRQISSGNTVLEIPSDMLSVSRRIDISSTEIRNRIASGKSIRYLMPEKVCSILQQENSYQIQK
ncbi:MAG: nicotinate-nucleotide adenylyltransferase [Chthoniobacterales bacterium]